MFVIEEYLERDGNSPFKQWLDKIDNKLQQRILARITRFQDGNFGDYKKITEDIFEVRFSLAQGIEFILQR